MNNVIAVGYIGYDPATFSALCRGARYVRPSWSARIPWLAENFGNRADNILSAVYRETNDTTYIQRLFASVKIVCAYPFMSNHGKRYFNFVLQHVVRKIPHHNLETQEGIVEIEKSNVPVAVVSYWGMFDKRLITMFPKGLVNIHPSCLPQYRGALPTLWTLKNRDSKTAVSYMILKEGMDTGPLIGMDQFDVSVSDTWLDIEKAVSRCVAKTLPKLLWEYVHNQVEPKEQNHEVATYTEKYSVYMKINPAEECADDVVNKVCLYPYFDPHELCYFILRDGTKVPVVHAKLDDSVEKTEFAQSVLRVRFSDGGVLFKISNEVSDDVVNQLVLELKKHNGNDIR